MPNRQWIERCERQRAERIVRLAFIENCDTDQCVLWPWKIAVRGYAEVGHRIMGHQYACEFANGPRPSPKHEAAHECGVRACVNPRHLSWKTRAENHNDLWRHGTMSSGSNAPRAKLTKEQALLIRNSTEPNKILAKRYGVNPAVISRVKNGKAYRWEEKL